MLSIKACQAEIREAATLTSAPGNQGRLLAQRVGEALVPLSWGQMPGQKGDGFLPQALIENTYSLPGAVLDVGSTVILKRDKVSVVLELMFCRAETVMSNLKTIGACRGLHPAEG